LKYEKKHKIRILEHWPQHGNLARGLKVDSPAMRHVLTITNSICRVNAEVVSRPNFDVVNVML